MPHIVVAIPVRDEAGMIADCLRALALQQGEHRADILLLVNNSSDGTADIATALRPSLPCVVHVVEHSFPPEQANAGFARRLAMSKAAMMAAPGGVVMTTDADGCVAPDWLETNLAALAAGVDCVCGRAVIDAVDALRIPRHLHDDDAVEVGYGRQLDYIGWQVDPDPYDPWPRHTEESGASIAVRREVFLAAGGVPGVASGEDRALVDALRRVDARIRHDPAVTVTVSGRTQGRAAGGMADTIRRRLQRQDDHLDSALEPLPNRLRRVEGRRLFRMAWADATNRAAMLEEISVQLEVSSERLEGWLRLPYFGAAWALVEAASPVLARVPVARAEVFTQMRLARRTLDRLAQARLSLGLGKEGLLF